MLTLLILIAIVFAFGGLVGLIGRRLWLNRQRHADEPPGQLDLGMPGETDTEPPPPAPQPEGPGFAFRSARLRRPLPWWAVVRIALMVSLVAAALAAALYWLGYLIKAQLDRVLGP